MRKTKETFLIDEELIIAIKNENKAVLHCSKRIILLLGTLLVILGSFLPWEIEGDFLSVWRYGIQIFPFFADNGGILVLFLGLLIMGLLFRSEGFVKSPVKWVLTSAITLFIISAYHVIDWLVRRIAANGIFGAPAIKIGLILVGIGSVLILAIAVFVSSKESANYIQE